MKAMYYSVSRDPVGLRVYIPMFTLKCYYKNIFYEILKLELGHIDARQFHCPSNADLKRKIITGGHIVQYSVFNDQTNERI